MKKTNVIKNKSLSHVTTFPMMVIGLAITACLLFSIGCTTNNSQNKQDSSLITLKVQKIGDDFEALTNIAFPGNGDMWVTEQAGKIWIVRNGQRLNTPLLDMTSKIVKLHDGYEERGLLGIAFHPQFKTNKKFYLFYSRPSSTSNHTGVLAEYTLTDSLPIDPNSGRIILTVEEPDGNHNGGCIKFGPDGN